MINNKAGANKDGIVCTFSNSVDTTILEARLSISECSNLTENSKFDIGLSALFILAKSLKNNEVDEKTIREITKVSFCDFEVSVDEVKYYAVSKKRDQVINDINEAFSF